LTSKEFIDSGLLELYVLGTLSEEERAEVVRMCSEFPEVKAELAAIEASMEAIDQSLAVAPSAAVKSGLFEKLESATPKQGKQVTMNATGNRPSGSSWMLAASVTIAIISLATAVFYFQKYNDLSGDYEALVAQNAQMAQDLNQVKNSLTENESLLALATDESTQRIALNATQEGSNLQVFVYWNTTSQEVYLDLGNLSMPGSQEDYQLWAIVGGQPVDMGVINFNDPASLQKMNAIQGAVAFAITLEPKGGKPAPTLENMVVLGKVSA
jgi:anti-sigma-K factor RskA